ncbi:lipoprotein [Niallia sp. 03133]|uniref:lipoprotein n=1 Tax=Niallia sp. 03133 TaxID=3458060 RepID=UPI004043F459
MKIKLLLITLLVVPMLFGCKNKEEKTKEKYDSIINQVITLENIKLQKEKILKNNEILKREETGIIVYSDGKYISLIYTLDSNKQIESIYQEKNKEYELFPQNSNNLKKFTNISRKQVIQKM